MTNNNITNLCPECFCNEYYTNGIINGRICCNCEQEYYTDVDYSIKIEDHSKESKDET